MLSQVNHHKKQRHTNARIETSKATRRSGMEVINAPTTIASAADIPGPVSHSPKNTAAKSAEKLPCEYKAGVT